MTSFSKFKFEMFIFAFLLSAIALVFPIDSAQAACATPAASVGALDFQGGVFKYCNGTSWLPVGTIDASLLTMGTLADARLSANVAMKNAANTFTVGGQLITNDAVATKPLVIRAIAAQTAPLQEWQTSASGVLYGLDISGVPVATTDLVTKSYVTTSVGNYVLKAGDTMTGALATAVGTAALPGHTFAGFTGTGMFETGTNILGLSTAGAERMRIDAAGNVGIGTATPKGRLTVSHGLDYPLNIAQSNNSSGDMNILHNAYAIPGAPGTYNWAKTHGSFGSRGIQFDFLNGINFFADNAASTADAAFTPTSRLTISNAGNVGIGTTSPASKFHVAGSTGINWSSAAASTGNVTIGNTDGSGGSLFVQTPSFVGSYANSGLGVYGTYTANNSFVNLTAYGANANPYAGHLAISTTNNGVVNENIRINGASGNVGIGTTAPAYKLDVAGAINVTSLLLNGTDISTSASAWTVGSGNAYRTTGNVGIGMAAPGAPLEVRAAASTSGIRLSSNTTPATYYSDWKQNDGNTTLYGKNSDLSLIADSRNFYTSGGGGWGNAHTLNTTNPMTYSSAGVQTTFISALTSWAPTAASGSFVGFDLNPTINQTGTASGAYTGLKVNVVEAAFLGSDGRLLDLQKNGTSQLVVKNSGNVGIGTTAPNILGTGGRVTTIYGGNGNLELASNAADAAGTTSGRVLYAFDSNSANHKIISSIESITEGATANQRGGVLQFLTKPNASTTNTERVRIDSTGNVGIGTTNPLNALDVGTSGGIRMASGIPGSTANALYNNSGALYFNGTSVGFANPMTTSGDVIYGGASGASTRLAGNITTTRKYLTQTGSGAASAAPTWGTITSGDVSTALGGTSTSSMTMNGLGQVGINLSSVAGAGYDSWMTIASNGGNGANLSLIGTSTASRWMLSSNYVWAPSNAFSITNVANGTAPYFMVNNSGNVGIGTTAASEKLQVAGSIMLDKAANGVDYISTPAGQELTLRTGNNGNAPFGTTDFRLYTVGGGYAGIDYGGAGTYQFVPGYPGMQFHMGYSGITFTNPGGNGGTNKFSIDSAPGTVITGGYVGIGTTNPISRLNVVGGTLNSGGGSGLGFATELASGRFVTPSTGTVAAIASSTDASVVEISAGSTGGQSGIAMSGASVGANPSTLQFFANGLERIRVSSAGNVGIGTTNPGYNLHVVGTAGLSTGTAWTNASDARLKDIHGDYEYGLEEILKLHTVRYNYKKNNALGLPSDKPMTGFIAQEVQTVIPDAVHKRDDGYLELNVDPIHWAAINAIQELHGMCKLTDVRVERNTSDIEELKRDLASVKTDNDKLKQENAEMKTRLERIEQLLQAK